MKEFYIDDDGIRLHAKLDMPVGYKEGGKCPLVIVIHGLTGHMEERHITAVARTMNETGYATLRAEMYGHGGSDGEFFRHNLFKWLGNIMTVTEYAMALDFVTDLYIAGHSQGGLATILAAGLMPERFRAIIPMSPAVSLTDGARKGANFGKTFDPERIPDEIYVNDTMKVSGNHLRAAQLLDTDYAISRYHGDVLIIQGDQDEAVPAEYAVYTAEKYENARLVMIAGDDHCYNYHLDQVLDAVRNFLTEIR